MREMGHGCGVAHALTQVCKAQALYMCGEPYKHAAALLVSEALHRLPEHKGALLEYARIVMDRGLAADAMRILLRLLVNSHERTAVRQACSLLPRQLCPFTWRVFTCTHQNSCFMSTGSQCILDHCPLPPCMLQS